MSSGVRELRVWQEAVALGGEVVRAARHGMRRETRAVSEALMTSALSVGTHIADGYARPTPAEQRESYLSGKRALLRLETELAIARHSELIPAGAFTDLTARSAQVARLLAGYVLFLDRQIADAVERSGQGEAARAVTRDSGRVPS